MHAAMTATGPENLSSSARKTALVVARITFYIGLILGMVLGAGAVTFLMVSPQTFPDPTERWLVGGVFIGLSIMSFGFCGMAKSRIEKLKGGAS
jgi:NO-binding membrane sensor protein with MHYT domain